MRVSGACPRARVRLSTSVTSTEKIIIHGGLPSNSECWKAKIDSNKIIWEQLESTGEDRDSHSSDTIGSHIIFIGGTDDKDSIKSTLA